ncbi:MAG: amidohydrolase [Candidatus Cloacimonetes bacterium]|nr:amidohydrolase [Candidatus Cloacimonadota bacterium]
MPDKTIKDLIEFRHFLHSKAELSHQEHITSDSIFNRIIKLKPTSYLKIDTGLLFVWESAYPGETTLFRADMDALPITEDKNKSYSSENEGVAHLCGHDGHSAILCGLAEKIFSDLPKKGKVILLFQPAEEIGEGAEAITKHPDFLALKPDKIFGFHNIPGYPLNEILLRRENFASASRGMIVKLFGKTSHAGEPENGINPVFAIEKFIHQFYQLQASKEKFSDFIALTIIHLRLGEIAFGTSPGYAEIMATLRAYKNSDMDILVEESEKIIQTITGEENLKYSIEYREIFPAIVNEEACVRILEKTAKTLSLPVKHLEKPFRWSEDFSYFTNLYNGAFFGIGAGLNQPQLHSPEYDFPDAIIETGVDFLFQIYKQINH